MYDPALGRWHCIDNLAEDFYSWSPYNYVSNNPVLMIDPDGNAGEISIQRDEDENITGATLQVNLILYSDQVSQEDLGTMAQENKG